MYMYRYMIYVYISCLSCKGAGTFSVSWVFVMRFVYLTTSSPFWERHPLTPFDTWLVRRQREKFHFSWFPWRESDPFLVAVSHLFSMFTLLIYCKDLRERCSPIFGQGHFSKNGRRKKRFRIPPAPKTIPQIKDCFNTPLHHTPGNPPSRLWKKSLFSLLVKV